MAGYKIDRIAQDIKHDLADIMRSLKDPRITGLLSIVRVEVTNDLSYAKIYIGAMEGLDTAKKSVEGLKSASGYIRHELGTRMKIKKIPELRFIPDNSIEHSAHIAHMLEDMDSDDGKSDT